MCSCFSDLISFTHCVHEGFYLGLCYDSGVFTPTGSHSEVKLAGNAYTNGCRSSRHRKSPRMKVQALMLLLVSVCMKRIITRLEKSCRISCILKHSDISHWLVLQKVERVFAIPPSQRALPSHRGCNHRHGMASWGL